MKYRYIIDIVLNKLRIFGDRDEYEQVGLIALWKALEKYDSAVCDLEPYLYMQVRFAILNKLKRKYREIEHEVQDEQLFMYLPEKVCCQDARLLVEALLAKLSEEERKLVEYTYLEGYKGKEVAKLLDVTEEAVKKRRQRVLKKLQQILSNA